jgi:hypothetical protein
VVAAIIGNQYFANVPLTAGANTIVVTATAPDGTQASATAQVTSSGPSPTRVTGTPLQGVAPATVSFTITSDRPIQSVEGNFAAGFQICFEGGESFCFEPGSFFVSPLSEPLSFTYDQPGVYEARFNITHTDGTTVTKTLRIVVQDQQQLDQQLRQVWGEMTAALVRGDKASAMQYLNLQAKEKYGPVFDVLLPEMTQILGSFSDLQSVEIDGTVGEYAVNRIINGINRIFFIYFLRDVDGVWRVDSM